MRISVKRCCGVAENSFADTRYFYSMLGNDPYLGLQKMFKCIFSPNKESSASSEVSRWR